MTPWNQLTPSAKTEAIKIAYALVDVSALNLANEIAKTNEGCTKNAVLGFMQRNRAAFSEHPLQTPVHDKPVKSARSNPNPVKTKSGKVYTISAKPMPEPHKVAIPEPTPLLKELWQIERCECKWPISGEREKMLFCAVETTLGQSYCAHHHARSIGRGTKSERDAVRDGRDYSKPLKVSKLLGRISGRV